MTIEDLEIREAAKKLIRSYQKNIIRPTNRRRERFLRKYGTGIPIIKAMMLITGGLAIALDKPEGVKELHIPLVEQIPEYEVLLQKKKLKHLFHEETLLVDIYTMGDGVLYTVELIEALFDELL